MEGSCLSHITNPATSGGGGSGTVTSVQGGEGISTTPNPITSAGIVDLDIFKLATETTLADGDWLPFLDVSEGTDPDDQRRVTLADLALYIDGTIGPYQPLDAGLTALAGLTPAGIAVTDGADGWVTRAIAVTDTATIDFTITNADGSGGNPTITGSVLAAGISGLGFVDGTGVAGQVAYWSDTNTLAGDTALVYDATTNVLNAAGQVLVGALGTPSAVSAGIELQSTTSVVLLSRLTTAQVGAIGAGMQNGSLYYDTTLNQLRTKEDGQLHTMLVLSGRPGAENNPTISSTSGGMVTGGNLGDLVLRPNVLAASPNPNVVEVWSRLKVDNQGPSASGTYIHIDVGNGVYDIDNSILRVVQHTPVLTHNEDMTAVQLFRGNARHLTSDGSSIAYGDSRGLILTESFEPGAGATITATELTGYHFAPNYANTGTGNTIAEVNYGTFKNATLGASWTATSWRYAYMGVPAGAGTITTAGFAEIEDLDTFAGTTTNPSFSLWSKGTAVHLLHAGPVRIGDTTAPTEKLEVLGNILITNSGTSGELRILEPSGPSYTGFKAGAMIADLIYTMPTAFPTVSGQVLSGTTAGVLSWVAASSGATITVKEDGSTVDAAVTTLDFLESDGTLVTSSPAGEANINMMLYAKLAGRAGGQTYIGGLASGEDLILQSTADSTRGTVDVERQLRIHTATGVSITGAYNSTETPISVSLDASSPSFRAHAITGTITVTSNPAAFNLYSGVIAGGFTVASVGNLTMGVAQGFSYSPTYSPASASTTTNWAHRGLLTAPVFTAVAGGGTAAMGSLYALQLTGTLNTGWTATDWSTIRMSNPGGAGTITRLGGIELDALTLGTTNYSLWSKGASVFMAHGGPLVLGVSQTSLTAPNTGLTFDMSGAAAFRRVSDVALAAGQPAGTVFDDVNMDGRTFVRITGPTAAYQISSITGGVDGRILILYNTVAFNMTLQDNAGTGTAANRIITMTGANVATNAAGSAILVYDSSQSRWIALVTQP